jgi:hypothetical protein
VSVPWTERPAEVMTRTAATLNVAEGMVKALTAVAVALAALATALGALRLRRKRSGQKNEVVQGDASTQEHQDTKGS